MRRSRLLLLGLLLVVAALLVWWLAREPQREPPRGEGGGTRAAPRAGAGGTARLPGLQIPAQAGGAGRTVVRGGWGSGRGEFGRLLASESNPEGPMGLAFDRAGNLLVLDQVNRRLQRFDASGRLLGTQRIASETAQDLLVDSRGRTHVLSRLGERAGVEVLAADGSPAGELPVVGGKVSEGGAITGLFADEDGLYVETEHDDLVRVADAGGRAAGLSETLPGRPTRDGRLLIRAGILSKEEGRLYVQAHGRDRQLVWERPLSFPGPLLHILLLDSDRSGTIYVGAEVGDEDPGTHELANLSTVVARLDGEGRLTGSLSLPPTAEDGTESFRPLAVNDAGVIYQLAATPAGLTVSAHSF